jgi:large subunit ribosomal protein L19e
MKLENKKVLVARTIGVGKERIVFNKERLNEIKEAITRQDIRDLVASKAILIRSISGRKTKEKRKNRRKAGSIKMKVKTGKRDYMNAARKIRAYLFELKKKGKISNEDYYKIRTEIKAGTFKHKEQVRERLLIK